MEVWERELFFFLFFFFFCFFLFFFWRRRGEGVVLGVLGVQGSPLDLKNHFVDPRLDMHDIS